MRCSRACRARPRTRAAESRPRGVRHVPSCFELYPCACVPMTGPNNDTDREITSTHRTRVRVGCAASRCSRVRRARPRARVTESRPRRVRHVSSSLQLCPWACVSMIGPRINTDRKVSYTCRALVRVGCAPVRCSRVCRARPRACVTESRPRRVRHVPSCLELSPYACVWMIGPSIDTDREVSSTCRAPVRVGCAAVRCSRACVAIGRARVTGSRPRRVRHVPS